MQPPMIYKNNQLNSDIIDKQKNVNLKIKI